MSYPPAPWKVRGYALQTLQFIDIERARPFVPPELDIVALVPGKTLAGVFLAYYGPGSVMEYYELLVVAGLVRGVGKWGLWISHIYVDNDNSMHGGREIWGLPKELAHFTWDKGKRNRFVVQQGTQTLCTLDYGSPRWLLRQRLAVPQFSLLGTNLLKFASDFETRLGIASGHLNVPAGSPFASLGLGTARFTYHYGELDAMINEPYMIGKQSAFIRPQMAETV